jgi:hypothetical protein
MRGSDWERRRQKLRMENARPRIENEEAARKKIEA